ncbi:HNH endonuclease [Undibacterium sp. FT79W]|uniref:HNH endonuclease n=1 Tax=Undibacterium sp. FT79W TaxID=2762296 RepID=UPI00164AF170|nr:HNH endonuclease [Undibacterium sp. FT79W]MBC3878508.1 HNH endonuclease [Undibacterium sp. FT79W]
MSSAAPLQQATANSHSEARNTPRQLRQNSARSASEKQNSFADSRPQTTIQRRLRETAADSPQTTQLLALQRMAAASEHANQLKAMKATASAAALQRVEDEEPLQAKFSAIQRVEDEEPLQGKFSTAQRVEEDEPLQNKLMTAQRTEDEELLQGKFAPVQRVEEDELLQGKFDTVQRQEQIAARPNNTGLPNQLKSGIESLSGMSMDHVKVHYNSSQPAQLNALAYAQGSDIHVAPGQEQHLPHEAWHVVQQAQGRVKPTMQMKGGVPVNDDAWLETEADVMGEKSLRQGAVQMQNFQKTKVLGKAITQRSERQSPVLQRQAETRILYDSFKRICLDEGYIAGAIYLLDHAEIEYASDNLTTATLLTKKFPICAEFAATQIGIGLFIGNICTALYKLNPGNEESGEEFAPEDLDVIEDGADYDNIDHGSEGGDFEDLDSEAQSRVDSHSGYGMIERFEDAGGSVQLQAASNKLGDKKKHGKYTVSYKTTAAGSINFNSPQTLTPQSGFNSWIHKTGSTVNILKGKAINYVAQGGKVYKWNEKKNDRGLHFAAANYIYNGSKARRSPDGWTWHHLESPVGGMVLVRREVHSKHHHNGGVFLWNP